MKFRSTLVAALLGAGMLTSCNNPPPPPAPAPGPTQPATPPVPQAVAPPAAEQPQASLPEVDLHIDSATLHTEVASTEKEREIGLMYIGGMPDNHGMIFLMPTVQRATFWMKNTRIPLSVAFVDRNGVILDIHDMQPGDPRVPDSQLPVTESDTDQTAFALETNLHWFALNGIKPGDKIEPPPATLGTAEP